MFPQGKPLLRPVDESGERPIFILIEDCVYSSREQGLEITAPKNFLTDGASVPRDLVAWNIAGGYGLSAAVFHDYLYQTGAQPKDVADKLFLEILLEIGVAEWRANLMYVAVVEVGGWFYNEPKHAALKVRLGIIY